MVRLACDGAGLLGAVRAAVANLERHAEEINALNVFPVPDGDTGSNMLATCTEMLRYVRDDSSVEGVADRLREGALFGARGNSGVILSQVVRGLAEGFAGRRRFNGLDLAHALASASTAAYGAVPRPVEGTMLTVIREAAAAAVATAERENDIAAVLASATDAAEKALAKTPSLLPVLRDAGVVDSGGAGLVRLFEGALGFLRGEAPAPAARPSAFPSPVPAGVAVGEAGHGYETVYLIRPFPGQLLDLDRITGYLVRTGESVNVAGDAKAAKIHVHNGRPDLVMRQALRLGRIVNATILDLDHQTDEVREARSVAGLGAATAVAIEAQPADADGARVPLGIIAVVPGDGFTPYFEEVALSGEVAVEIVRGGQAENPSAGEILEAIRRSPAEEILILPNNPNVKLAAGQAAEMSDRPTRVVPTRNAAEGLAAVLALQAADGASGNAERMLRASREVQTLLVTAAVRDARVGGHQVREGQTMALDPDDGLLAVGDDRDAAILEGLCSFTPGFGLVTLWYGEDASLAEAEGLAQRIHARWPALDDVEVRTGLQPHYRYLISAE
ncbi:MAG TPA: DAK2 domain-containing protein [Candidatus Limnocylindrales bacterium]